MDKEFLEKLNSVTEWKQVDEKGEQMKFALSFSNEGEGLVKIETAKGGFVYKLKQLNELFSPGNDKTPVIVWKDQRYMPLLYTIERAIKKVYEECSYRLTDSDVIPALKALAVKSESVSKNSISKSINQELRLQLSTNDFSRQEVKMAIRRILNSAERHNKHRGLRGYLDFIVKCVP
ncbi:MAG: hypothetical protein HRU72_02940 [Planctomycetia bacterium]|uniref:Uncharacterized protein n=1 Tax=Candidatus Brocadia sapporoensis TaxID=392547 RepID=A0A1V6M1A3_9BACT|nr:hypothetical protein [Candidatus Brocadia sapporoensis]MCC7238310.1 hypothetical protein [Candidatus Brocadia sp.]QOJ05571.1 MAG: hypothetical protein HRU72_02940 [Planctomycetia bacterium]TVL98508.1 MAG: hypothetical protein CV082_00095 [Candidatus Brocadia sp. BL1]MDG6006264.1 hypothetical protein [Candidatus Brocadia sp.]OQD46182.1 hypothetical protein BIY37_04590 [Candidatus Brocadia sapporoensis]